MTFDAEKSKKECNPVKSPNCDGDHQILCVFSDVMERFVCCHRGSRSRYELKECPGMMIRDPNNQTCSLTQLCKPPSICIRRNLDRIGLCCRHRRSSHLISFPLDCPVGEKPHKDSSGHVKICNEKIICPQPYKCKLSDTPGSRSRICCMDPPVRKIDCPHKLLPLSADGQEQSCKNHACPSGYKCHNQGCCPTEEFACSVPFFAGVKCGLAPQATRWYFSSTTGRCQSFVYFGCTPSANNFPDERTCYRLCIENEALDGKKQCSHPYENPEKSSIAKECSYEEERGDCGDGQLCVLNAYGKHLCCTIKDIFLEDRSKLINKEISEMGEYNLDSFCGPDYVPLLDTENEEPVACHPFSSPCSREHICQYTRIVKGYICCFKPPRNIPALISSSILRTDDDYSYSLET